MMTNLGSKDFDNSLQSQKLKSRLCQLLSIKEISKNSVIQ